MIVNTFKLLLCQLGPYIFEDTERTFYWPGCMLFSQVMWGDKVYAMGTTSYSGSPNWIGQGGIINITVVRLV